MRFDLVDAVLDRGPGRIVTLKKVSAAEEYLADHFPTFPVLPGVLMLEAMVQAARLLASEQAGEPLVLGSVRALKYGRIVQPGDSLRIEVAGALGARTGPPSSRGRLASSGRTASSGGWQPRGGLRSGRYDWRRRRWANRLASCSMAARMGQPASPRKQDDSR